MNSRWLQTQFKLNPKKTKAQLAKNLGLPPPAVSKILKGTRQIKAQEYIIMREFFGLPNDGGRALGKSSNSYTIGPLKQKSGLEENQENTSGSEWVIPANILSNRTQAPPEKIKIFRIQENIMAPDFRQGEYVLVDLSDTAPSPPGAFIISDGFGYMIRHCEFMPESNPPEIKVFARKQGIETKIIEIDKANITGRVIAKMQML